MCVCSSCIFESVCNLYIIEKVGDRNCSGPAAFGCMEMILLYVSLFCLFFSSVCLIKNCDKEQRRSKLRGNRLHREQVKMFKGVSLTNY